MNHYTLYNAEYKDISLKIRKGVETTLESDFDTSPPGDSDLGWGASETLRVRDLISLRLGFVRVFSCIRLLRISTAFCGSQGV